MSSGPKRRYIYSTYDLLPVPFFFKIIVVCAFIFFSDDTH